MVPGDETGEFHLSCAEYCGTEHSQTIGRVVVMEPNDYEQWLQGVQPELPSATPGKAIFERLGCPNCHFEGAGRRAPALAGVYGTTVPLADGRTVVADENYFRESILAPEAKVVAGYAPIMPTFKGLISDERIGNSKVLLPAGDPHDCGALMYLRWRRCL